VLKGLEPDGKLVWTYFEAMVPDSIPKSLLVIGSGAIGIEFASFYRTLGCDVTVVEVLPEILPAEDEEIARFARKRLREAGHEDRHRRQGGETRQEEGLGDRHDRGR
jgi:dihydrolipoamide dehydrogenase